MIDIKNCYGCGVCAIVCPKQIITIALNDNGFYEPTITDSNRCTNCDLCLDVCAFHHQNSTLDQQFDIRSYAAWSKDANTRHKCSSGGVGFEIGKSFIESGYKVCAVKYNAAKEYAEHYIATTVEELIPSIGSKYIQSYPIDGFKAIDKNQKYLITGTPCQIDSFRRLIQRKKIEDNFVLLDFFCHGVPSMLAWRYYLATVEQKTGEVLTASWRNKSTGWHDSWNMSITGKRVSLNSRKSQGDLFYKLFLGDYCCNPACQTNCKYKYKSSAADIRIGDFWGKTYQKNEAGVSALIAFTLQGFNAISQLKNCILLEYPFKTVAEGQMKKNVGKANLAFSVMWCLKKGRVPLSVLNGLFFIEKILRKLKSVFAL